MHEGKGAQSMNDFFIHLLILSYLLIFCIYICVLLAPLSECWKNTGIGTEEMTQLHIS